MNKLNAAITEFLHSLERLATGLLDPALITPDHLDEVLQDIEIHIQEAFPHLSLLKKTKSFYYTSRSCIPMRMKDKLIIFLHIPLTSWNQNFHCFPSRNTVVADTGKLYACHSNFRTPQISDRQ